VPSDLSLDPQKLIRMDAVLDAGIGLWKNRLQPHQLWPQGALTRAHPGQSPIPEPSNLRFAGLLLFILSISIPGTLAKEAVIFVQIGQLAGITVYLHVHVELSISSVEAQLVKYRQLLKENGDSELDS